MIGLLTALLVLTGSEGRRKANILVGFRAVAVSGGFFRIKMKKDMLLFNVIVSACPLRVGDLIRGIQFDIVVL